MQTATYDMYPIMNLDLNLCREQYHCQSKYCNIFQHVLTDTYIIMYIQYTVQCQGAGMGDILAPTASKKYGRHQIIIASMFYIFHIYFSKVANQPPRRGF